jgi:hypothetical protein
MSSKCQSSNIGCTMVVQILTFVLIKLAVEFLIVLDEWLNNWGLPSRVARWLRAAWPRSVVALDRAARRCNNIGPYNKNSSYTQSNQG